MTIDRARFLALVTVLAGCGDSRKEASSPSPTPSTATASTSASAAPSAASASSAPSAASASSAPSAGASASPAPAQCPQVTVPECVDFGLPAPTCEQGMSPSFDCARLRATLTPAAASAAVQCMLDARGTCAVHRAGAAHECFLGALSSACVEPSSNRACAPVVAKCGSRVGKDECAAAVSAIAPERRSAFVSCVTEGCSLDCFDPAEGGRTPTPKGLPKAPPPRSVAAEIARWPGARAPLPPEWTACKLATDCVVVSTARCGSLVANRRGAPFVSERLRLEHAAKPDPSDRFRECAGPPTAACVAGTCTPQRP